MKRRGFLAAAATLAVGGCSLAPANIQPALYDFGIEPLPQIDATLTSRIALAHVSANSWLQTPAIVYRLAYRDPAQLRPYSLSRWAAPPADLITQRLRLALGRAGGNGFSMAADGIATDHLLRVHLEAFEQVVDSPASGRALVRMAGSITGSERRLRAHRQFEVERPCTSIDAAGSVHALTAATDALIAQIVAWVAAETRS
jgi:cholesterol transport system auxiliary component